MNESNEYDLVIAAIKASTELVIARNSAGTQARAEEWTLYFNTIASAALPKTLGLPRKSQENE